MPVVASTRRRRKQNSEEIEDARLTQANGRHDDVSDEDNPRPVRVKQEKKNKGKQRAVEPEDDVANGDVDVDDDSGEEHRVDVANFTDQPLRKDHLTRLRGISQDWDSMRQQINQRCDIYKDVAGAMAEAGEIDIHTSKTLKKLDDGIKEFIDVGMEMLAHSQALDALYQKVARGELIDNATERYELQVKDGIDAYAGQTSRQKYAKDQRYMDFHSSIWEVHHPDEAMPPITEFIGKENGDDSDSDEELEMGGVTQKFLCPITLTPLVNPVTSNVCGHSFSRDAIKSIFKNPAIPEKCPSSGCNKRFRFLDCVQDEALAKKVKAHQRRQRAAQVDSDAEEVVD